MTNNINKIKRIATIFNIISFVFILEMFLPFGLFAICEYTGMECNKITILIHELICGIIWTGAMEINIKLEVKKDIELYKKHGA